MLANSHWWREKKNRRNLLWLVGKKLEKAYHPLSQVGFDLLRLRCHVRFRLKHRAIKVSYGEIACKYEAVSAEDLLCLSIGSQNENAFMPMVFKKYVHRADVCLDIGGSRGMYAVPLALKVGDMGQVIVFEPDPESRVALLHNLSLNGLNNVKVLDMAIGSCNGSTPFYIRPKKDTHSIYETVPYQLPVEQHSIMVRVARIDTLVSNEEIPPPDFIKVDVEGAELEVVQGLGRAIAFTKAVLIEIHERMFKHRGIENPHGLLVEELGNLGFTEFDYLDDIHLLALKKGA